MREFFAVSSALVILTMTKCAIREDRSKPKCDWVSPYKNTLQQDIHRECRE